MARHYGHFNDAREALKIGNLFAPSVVYWDQNKGQWAVTDGETVAGEAEFLCTEQGNLPMPLSESAWDVWWAVVYACQHNMPIFNPVLT